MAALSADASRDLTGASGDLKTWIDDQMALPPTLHREYYRERVNPRIPRHWPTPVAGARPVCSAGSRWSRFAFNKADHGDELVVSAVSTLTGFAAHACRVESVIRDLRANISAEQLQNFELVSKVVDEVLTPLQTCVICAKWGSGCPDMLAVTRAITVQTMELMPELR